MLSEATSNFRRNLLMSTAAILTAMISLSLVGGALLVRQGVNRATIQWRGGAELSIFMLPDAQEQQVEAVRTKLLSMRDVKSFTYVNKEDAFVEARELFSNDPDTLANLTPAAMPTSFRVVPAKTELIDSIGKRFTGDAGVRRVAYAEEAIKKMVLITQVLQIALLFIAAVLLISATLLILNSIRVAIFARRREVAVMKLVGATNWFIRVPFMMEGLVQGLIGAVGASIIVLGGREVMEKLAGEVGGNDLYKMVVTPRDAIGTCLFLLIIGVGVGVVGSAAAVRRFLDT